MCNISWHLNHRRRQQLAITRARAVHYTTITRYKEHLKTGAGAFRALRALSVGEAQNKTIRDNYSNPMVDNFHLDRLLASKSRLQKLSHPLTVGVFLLNSQPIIRDPTQPETLSANHNPQKLLVHHRMKFKDGRRQ